MWENAFAPNVHHDKNRGREISGQIFDQLSQSLDAARRRADDNDIEIWHEYVPALKN